MSSATRIRMGGALGAILLFGFLHALDEFLIAISVETTMAVGGVQRDASLIELVFIALYDAVAALPLGVAAVALLFFPTLLVAHSLRRVPSGVAYPVTVLIGAVSGVVLSFVTWMMVGGWGPPFALPALTSGALLAATLIYAARRSLPSKPCNRQ